MRRIRTILAQRQPFGEEPAVAGREMLVEHPGFEDAVGAEVTEAVSQLAPGRYHCDIDVVRHRDRPDRAFAAPAFAVEVGDSQLAMPPNGLAHRRQVDADR